MFKNNTDRAYLNLIDKIFTEGQSRGDRTGTGTWSIFSHTLDLDMTEGFPLLTTKKMFTKGIIYELLWFLNGDTNIKNLVDNGVNIWTSDAYREYLSSNVGYTDSAYNTTMNDETVTRHLTKEEFTEKIKDDSSFANRWGELGPVYGKQWIDWGGYEIVSGEVIGGFNKGINQIEMALDKLKNNPESRRNIVSSWNVGEIEKMSLPPCHWAFELYVEDANLKQKRAWVTDNAMDRYCQIWNDNAVDASFLGHGEIDKHFPDCPKKMLSLKWHQRSVDTFLGLPFNIASYGLLLHMFAQQADMIPNRLIGDLSNVHIYKNHVDQCNVQLSRDPWKLPRVKLNKAKDMFSYTFDDIEILDYESHTSIKGEISV